MTGRPLVLLACCLAGCLATGCGGRTAATSTASSTVGRAAGPLLHPGPGGDGDSWRDTAGREYRLGLVDTPEVGDCYADLATTRRRQLVAGGFRADVYTTDRYGRSVADVTTADGTDVNELLAREGLARGSYLAQYRAERPELAARLELALVAARQAGAGLWSSCPG